MAPFLNLVGHREKTRRFFDLLSYVVMSSHASILIFHIVLLPGKILDSWEISTDAYIMKLFHSNILVSTVFRQLDHEG